MTRYDLDDTDLAIIEILRKDGRAALAKIGDAVGLSADAVRIRLARLTADGAVRVVGIVHPSSLGYGVLGTVMIEYHGPLSELVAELEQYPEVTFMASALGDFNAICEVAARDDQALSDFTNNVIGQVTGVQRIEAWRMLDVVKWAVQGRPPPATDSITTRAPLDELDMSILRMLTESPRLTYRELQHAVGVAYSVARRRARALFQSGAIIATVVVDLVNTYPRVMALICIQFGGGSEATMEYLCKASEVHILVRVSGRYNAIIEVSCDSHEHLADFIGGLLDQPGVQQAASYLMTQFSILPMPWALAGHRPPGPDAAIATGLPDSTTNSIHNGRPIALPADRDMRP
ncbi:MAG TPA: Lrp/AsnC family transcriptional regulator [Mycobacteriales bacterium]|nr:Lrp/AsnC family transcriptional regulator [Mycobacteriales bacterium]